MIIRRLCKLYVTSFKAYSLTNRIKPQLKKFFHSQKIINTLEVRSLAPNLMKRNFAKASIRISPITSSEPSPVDSYDSEYIRNIGIIAHIDAGKTTTTERMLVYSGVISQAGEVHHGNTVTDYLQQERDRGITIRAASVSFKWKEHQINLIDTPGHIDFTAEVERSLRVMDSAIIIFDASMGVETQTQTVWKQAQKYKIPTIAYINKIDKLGASISLCLFEINKKLKTCPLLINYPIGEENQFKGIVDLIALKYLTYHGTNGKDILDVPVSESPECKPYLKVINKLRNTLLDELSSYSDELMNKHLEGLQIDSNLIVSTLREATIQGKILPTLTGSSLKNKGVQQLLDSIIAFLPSPEESNPTKITRYIQSKNQDKNNHIPLHSQFTNIEEYKASLTKDEVFLNPNKRKEVQLGSNSEPVGFIFKIINDPNLGNLCYFKLYHGILKKGSTIKFTNLNERFLGKTEKVIQILRVKADECLQLQEIHSGDIGALVGLKDAESGLTFIGEHNQQLVYLDPIFIPDPVFFCSIYARSNAHSKELVRILQILQKEDPSLRLNEDKETGQNIISGLGELHLEIIRDRIEIDYGIKPILGKMRVAFREGIKGTGFHEHVLDKIVNREKLYMEMSIEVSQLDVDYKHERSNYSRYIKESNCEIVADFEEEEKYVHVVEDDDTGEVIKSINLLKPYYKKNLLNYVEDCLKLGVTLGYQLLNVRVNIKNGKYSNRRTTEVAMRICVTEALKASLMNAEPSVLEPQMLVETICSNDYSNAIVNEILKRKGSLESVTQEVIEPERQSRFCYNFLLDSDFQSKDKVSIQSIVTAYVPLSEMLGYSAFIRSATKGEATYFMKFHNFNFVSYALQEKIFSGEYFRD